MKPAPLRYLAPTTVEEALAHLDEAGEAGTVLAGGQSLVPLLNMRLASPGVLVDINRVAGLGTIEVEDDRVRVGATVRQTDLEHHADALAAIPLLGQALAHVAHPVIRNRGTVVGSIAHGDPAAELPAVLALLGGSVELRSVRGERTVPAAEFLLAPLETDVRPGELATAVTFPRAPAATGSAFEELARRHGDYAMAGVAATVAVDEGRVADARAAFLGVGDVPVVVELGDACRDQPVDEPVFVDAVDAGRAVLDPVEDIHASAAYRRHLAGVLLGRALATATARATEGTRT